ncbi:Cytochrome P450 [Lentzea fradiae]|uniref:Cytochrome P450 n=1 Tax=Lentzea fradiae TaxID=200378 RepID=A0A1G8CUB2_9PSEU|nr:cytochrome P450 [Lentzea fradiae]SDH49107.1 Cytochrome P450 [Lentzea fradiae]
MSAPPATLDLTDLDLFVNGGHHAVFDWLREHDPVHWNATRDGSGFWAVTRHGDLVTAYREHGVFSSAAGAMLGGSIGSQIDSATGLMLVASDPPRQRQLRHVLHGAFAGHLLDRVREQVTGLVDRAVDRALADGGCDFATEIAPELPAGALMAMVGLDHDQARHLISLTRRMIGYRDPVLTEGGGTDRFGLAETQAEIFEFFADLLQDPRMTRGDGLVGLLSRATLNGRPMSEEEVLFNCMNVAVGGNETSSYTACTGALTLTAHPEQHERLLSEPVLLEPAINEMLRWASVNAYVQRVAKRDFELGGTTIRAGESVTLWNVSANRDARVFDDPHTFDITRTPNRHLAYGSGIHRCIGAQVAQIELETLFGRVVRDKIRFTLAGPPAPLRSNFILGTTSLPVHVTAERHH